MLRNKYADIKMREQRKMKHSILFHHSIFGDKTKPYNFI